MAAVIVMLCSNPVCMLIGAGKKTGVGFFSLSKNLLGLGYRKQTTFHRANLFRII